MNSFFHSLLAFIICFYASIFRTFFCRNFCSNTFLFGDLRQWSKFVTLFWSVSLAFKLKFTQYFLLIFNLFLLFTLDLYFQFVVRIQTESSILKTVLETCSSSFFHFPFNYFDTSLNEMSKQIKTNRYISFSPHCAISLFTPSGSTSDSSTFSVWCSKNFHYKEMAWQLNLLVLQNSVLYSCN